MVKKARPMSDILFERIRKSCNLVNRAKEIQEEKDPEIKMELEYLLSKDLTKSALLEISYLTETEFRRLKTEHKKGLDEMARKFGTEYLEKRMRVGGVTVQELDESIMRGYMTIELRDRRPSPIERKALSKKSTLERMLFLTKMYNFQLQFQMAMELHYLEPLFEANQIISRQFGFDQNWSLAIVILATQENLIKKKLVSLGMNEDEIIHISKGKGIDSLLERLTSLMETKENRQPSLTFYMTSSLRKVRNRLEHEGYKQPVTNEEVLELLKDMKRFEAEIFRK